MENSQKPNEHRYIKQAYRTAYLIAGFLKQTLSGEEKEELDTWILASDENMILFEKMTDEKNLEQAAGWFKQMNVEDELKETKRKIQQRKSTHLWSYIIAAAVIVILLGSIYLYQSNINKIKAPIAANRQDMLPGSDKAILTLNNGQQVILSNEGTDTAISNQIKLLRKDGQLVYNNDTLIKKLVYNTLTVPRKGQYKLVLPDGTNVWLNAESSIRYPVAFIGNERKVFVTGETYFAVAKDERKPFHVVAGAVMLEDLGTEFNVNAYNNEPFFAATLVEGSVKVIKDLKENILKPGQQAKVTGNSIEIINSDVNDVIAWKTNQFKFNGTSIDEIMRQVERWYDVNVVFQDNVSLHLNATIERNVPVSKLLQILEETGQVHFKIEDKKIIVMK